MARNRKRVQIIASPEKQSEIREQIREFGPVPYIVGFLEKPWIGFEKDDDGNVAIVDRTQENAEKCKIACQFLNKVVPNLRHTSVDQRVTRGKGLKDASHDELVQAVIDRHADRFPRPSGEGTTKAN